VREDLLDDLVDDDRSARGMYVEELHGEPGRDVPGDERDPALQEERERLPGMCLGRRKPTWIRSPSGGLLSNAPPVDLVTT